MRPGYHHLHPTATVAYGLCRASDIHSTFAHEIQFSSTNSIYIYMYVCLFIAFFLVFNEFLFGELFNDVSGGSVPQQFNRCSSRKLAWVSTGFAAWKHRKNISKTHVTGIDTSYAIHMPTM